MSQGFKEVSIADFENDASKEVFVINTTRGDARGEVILAVPRKNGDGRDVLVVPLTFIPVSLTDQIPKSQLLDSVDLRRAVRTGQLKFVDNQEAELVLRTEEAREEQDRIYNRRSKVSEAINADTTANFVGDSLEMDLNRDNEEHVKDLAEQGLIAKPTVLQVVVDLEEGQVSESQAIATLRRAEGLNETDYRYIYKNVNKKFKDLRKWAKETSKKS